MDVNLPKHINYWITSTSKHDCFFNVGLDSGPRERIGAIRIFLTGHSEVFRKMLEESPLSEKGDILVNDTNPETFKNFLKCIYGGADFVIGKLSFEESLGILYLSEKYLTVELRENISSCILKRHQPLSVDNVLMILLSPVCLESKNITEAIKTVIQNQTDDILQNKLFLDLESKAVEFVVKQDKITGQEIDLWTAVLNWAKNKASDCENAKELRSYLGNILKHIRFCTMESDDFCVTVIPSNVLTQDEVFEVCKSIGTGNPPELENRLCCEVTMRAKISHERKSTVIENIAGLSCSKNILQVEICSYQFTIELCPETWYDRYERKEKKKLHLKLHCSRSGTKNKLPWKCSVKLTMSVGSCKYCRSIVSKSYSLEMSNTLSSTFLNSGPSSDPFLSEGELIAVANSSEIEIHLVVENCKKIMFMVDLPT